MNKIQTKIQNTSRKMSIALKIGYYMMLLAALLALAGIFILMFSGETTKQSFLEAFHLTTKNGIVISIAPQNLMVMFLAMLTYAVFLFFILYMVFSIFRDISIDYTPFKLKYSVRIKRIGIMIIILSVIGNFFDALGNLYILGETSWYIDFFGIIFGIIICCLALIFDYGCELQLQSDETL